MFQKLYEFLLYRSLDNIKLYNFLVQAFPEREKEYINRIEKKATEVYISENDMKQMQKETWEKICEQIR